MAGCEQPFDRFVLDRMSRAGLTPNPESAPLRWLRRVTMDLTGLPPTVEAIRAFQDAVTLKGEGAYESVVGRTPGIGGLWRAYGGWLA